MRLDHMENGTERGTGHSELLATRPTGTAGRGPIVVHLCGGVRGNIRCVALSACHST
eukprot:CAMPEP_0119373920 /NCGR_PEP_ID=MMETSP1334-20130426/27921_1 /TAXON_ID=127549 /ORGANISM="Calcidiscus leptoporus, Strain RCC1130" /LENGTH=56 /DNA_ID=CAMNT_0007391821 /DNA_START=128 /DNA_END=295 /DNA_ORIENTATION=-